MAIAGEKSSKWVDLLPEEELAAMEAVILKLLKNMFQLKAQVISSAYGGEKFGKGVYYRLVYSREQDDKKWEILLVFEDSILINTVGKLMGVKYHVDECSPVYGMPICETCHGSLPGHSVL